VPRAGRGYGDRARKRSRRVDRDVLALVCGQPDVRITVSTAVARAEAAGFTTEAGICSFVELWCQRGERILIAEVLGDGSLSEEQKLAATGVR
jgi:hypothetical protein